MDAKRTLEEIKQEVQRLGAEFHHAQNYTDGKGFIIEPAPNATEAVVAQLELLAAAISPVWGIEVARPARSRGAEGVSAISGHIDID